MTANYKTIPKVATDANYAAGVDPWCGTPTKVAPSGGFQTKGWVPGQPIPAPYENFHKDAVNQCIDELQTLAAELTAAGTTSGTGALFWLPNTKVVIHVEGTNPNQYAAASPLDVARLAIGTTSSHFKDWDFLGCYGPQTTNGLLYVASIVAGSQPDVVSIADTKARLIAFPTAGASGAGGWLDMAFNGATGTPTLLDAAGVSSYGGSWVTHAFASGTWACLAPKDVSALYAFAPNRTAWNAGAPTTTWTEAAATWDGAAGSPPSSASMFRPVWDSVNTRWLVATADISSDANAAATSKVWTSTDGYTWVTLAALPTFTPVRMFMARGVIWAVGRTIDVSGARSHGGLEVYVSKDGGTTWMRTHWILTLVQSTTLGDFLRKVMISGDDYALCFSSGLGVNTEYLTVRLGLA